MSISIPTRLPEGLAIANKGELLSEFGGANSFNWHALFDDFDWLGATGVKYTQTNPNSGTIAAAAGDGGRVLFTTGATSGNPASIQAPVAGFSLTLGRRAWYAARFNLASVSVPSFGAGLMQTTATIGTVTDGIMIEKATASTVITLKHYVGSVATLSLTMNAASIVPLDGGDFDVGFYLNEKGYLYGFGCTVANSGLFGYAQQNNGQFPNRSAICGGQIPALTAVNLNPTLGIITNATAAVTLNADFMMAAKERA